MSVGLLLYREKQNRIEFFLAHPGGPFWRNREEGAWTIPKGLLEGDEDPLAGAVREFREETGIVPIGPYLDLGSVRQKGGKTVQAWAWKGDADPREIESNVAVIEWPRGSGRRVEYPEVDRCGWFDFDVASRLINPAQVELLNRLLSAIAGARSESEDL